MKTRKIKYYNDFLSEELTHNILSEARSLFEISGLKHLGTFGGLENPNSIKFLCSLYHKMKDPLNSILEQRINDRKFLDERTKALFQFNQEYQVDYINEKYKTTLCLEDSSGRIVFGPKQSNYFEATGNKVAPIPHFLQGNHVTLFGPPDTAKMSINAMNSYHRKIKNEPPIIEELLKLNPSLPKWGADDEDSKTPLREDLIETGINLTGCLNKTIKFEDQKKYELEKSNLAIPIKRFPGLAIPCSFLFLNDEPIPLHLYDFSLHLFENWHNKEALCFYVPKLENEEEAKYIKLMIQTAEGMIKEIHPDYEIGSIRLMVVLENPRAIFRTNEIIDELHPYFMGASLGWHDFLASTARLFKEDGNYRIPVKADPDIVIKYIKASHDLLSDIVGARGGIKVGGMYGILPIDQDPNSESYQLTLKGYFKDVITQLKRNLDGFWVAHPDFVRIGLAIISAWKEFNKGNKNHLSNLVKSLFQEKYQQEIISFILGKDIDGLDKNHPLYSRSLIVADIKESTFISNNHPDEIRYNVFQSLQYLTDWLRGNGCVALPAHIGQTPVRVMDDLATAERSRWEVWHEINHGRFSIFDFLKIVHEEYHFIRKDLSNGSKIVQVKWTEETEKWYPVAKNIMIKLMTDKSPVEFATQLLLPFTIHQLREAKNPWEKAISFDKEKFQIRDEILRFNYYFDICGSKKFATKMSSNLIPDFNLAKEIISQFSKEEIIESAFFHGDIGENKKTLDHFAKNEQDSVAQSEADTINQLQLLGKRYKEKFGVKFLISAKEKSGEQLLEKLKLRLNGSEDSELENAREALWEISEKRFQALPLNNLLNKFNSLKNEFKVKDVQISILNNHSIQEICIGETNRNSFFEVASLSKSIATAFSLEYFKKKNISIYTSVNSLLRKTKSTFEIPNGDDVLVIHLLNHTALNLHYVNGVSLNEKMPPLRDLLEGNLKYNYSPIKVLNPPGTKFNYSGGGFLVLEHLIEALEEKSIESLTRPFLEKVDLSDFTFSHHDLPDRNYAEGYLESGEKIPYGRKMFPAFAAGGLGTSRSVAQFLSHLEKSYHQSDNNLPISHETARNMLYGIDKGSMNFMGVKVGLGVFVGEAGENKMAIHQGANDGFRAIYLHCFDGPDRGKGFVIFCNADNNGVIFISLISQLILKELHFSGINFSKFNSHFKWSSLPQEQIVNLGYKELIFNAFEPNLPEKIISNGRKESLSEFNILRDSTIVSCSNQKFARAENLISEYLPSFDPELFGKQGKIMDSWETVRHNQEGVDELVFKLKTKSEVQYVFISTKFHSGNHAPTISLAGKCGEEWILFLDKILLEGHSELKFKLENKTQSFEEIKVQIFPDGGLTRLGLYNEIPSDCVGSFPSFSQKKSTPCEEKIPQTKKPMVLEFESTSEEITRNWNSLTLGQEFNIASQYYGAKILMATNEHYAPAVQMLSPFPPLNMFDGLESSRSRIKNNSERAHIQFFRPGKIHRIIVDFKYFVNNNPMFISIDGITNEGLVNLVPKTFVKPYAGNEIMFEINLKDKINEIVLQTYPCGGLNRLKVYSRKS